MSNLEVPIDLASQSPISQSDIGNSLNRFTDLPPELLTPIFDALCPKWNRSPTNLFIVQYRRELQAFAELRLLSKAISLLITPALYEEIVIWLGAPARMERLSTLFATGFQYIRSFLIYSGDFNSAWYTEQIRDGLRLCSGIRNLECYGRHYLFSDPRSHWQTDLSHLTSLTRLVLVQHMSTQLSNALFELGDSLETLEVKYSIELYPTPPPDPQLLLLHGLPKLKDITLRGIDSYPLAADLKNLFTCITDRNRSTGTLQSVSLYKMKKLRGRDIIDILAINQLGTQLTIFRMADVEFIGIQTPVEIAKACPNLIELRLPYLSDGSILEHLPRNLQIFEVAIAAMARTLSLADLFAYSRSERGNQLRTILIHSVSHGSGYPNNADMVAACQPFGLECYQDGHDWEILL